MVLGHYFNDAGVFISFWKEMAFLININLRLTKILVLEGEPQMRRVAD